MNNRKIQYRVIPPKHAAEFVAGMEEVPEVYERLYNPNHPFLCMDEQPVQLIKETRAPIPATANHPERVDYDYERNGTASIFMFTEPLSGWREATARPRRTMGLSKWPVFLKIAMRNVKKSRWFATISILIQRERFMKLLLPTVHQCAELSSVTHQNMEAGSI